MSFEGTIATGMKPVYYHEIMARAIQQSRNVNDEFLFSRRSQKDLLLAQKKDIEMTRNQTDEWKMERELEKYAKWEESRRGFWLGIIGIGAGFIIIISVITAMFLNNYLQ